MRFYGLRQASSGHGLEVKKKIKNELNSSLQGSNQKLEIGGSSELHRLQLLGKSKPKKIMASQGFKGTWPMILIMERARGSLLLPVLCCAPISSHWTQR